MDLDAAGDPLPAHIRLALELVELDRTVLPDLEVRVERCDALTADHELALLTRADQEALSLDADRQAFALPGTDPDPHAANLPYWWRPARLLGNAA
jgi:hypothetical protein